MILILAILCFSSFSSNAKWKLTEFFPSGIDTIVFFENNIPFGIHNNFQEKLPDIKVNNDDLIWTASFQEQVNWTEDLMISADIHCVSIKSIMFFVHDISNDSWKQLFNFMQLNDTDSLHLFQRIKKEEGNITIDKIAIIANREKSNSSININIDNFLFGQKRRLGCYPPYLQSILGEKNANNKYTFPPDMLFVRGDSSDHEIDLLKNLTNIALQHYTFYTIRDLDKDSIIQVFNLFCEITDTKETGEFAVALKKFLAKTLHDGHFYLDLAKSPWYNKPYSPPIRCYFLNGDIQIAAVFDSIKGIDLGDKLLSVNGRDAYQLLDSLEMYQYGTIEHRRTNAVRKILYQKDYDTTRLVIRKRHSGDTVEINFLSKDKYSIPEEFFPKYCFGKFVGDSLYYYSINKWASGTFNEFLKSSDFFSKSKGIILDLRNNAGGSMNDMEKVLSCFIKHPEPIYHDLYKYSKESYIVYPNRDHQINQPITILIDDNTACASENFIGVIKQSKRGILIGCFPSNGAYKPTIGFRFPSGICFHVNFYGTNRLLPGIGIVEDKGIEPDIYVKINKIRDLYPYGDKVLQIAKQYLNNY